MLPIPSGLRSAMAAGAVGALLVASMACSETASSANQKRIVVTYSVLGSLVKDVVGNAADVTVLIPNGSDPHDWEPSAKDVARINHADLIVRNGLDLEGGMLDTLDRAKSDGVATFTAAEHITVRTVGEGEGLPTADPDQAVGAKDPHLWMDPLTMKDVIAALEPVLQQQGIDAAAGTRRVTAELDQLNADVASILSVIPQDRRKLVTGHESLGYFAARYGFTLVGALIPSLTTQAGASARALADLADKVRRQHVEAVFTEVGTPRQVADTIAHQTGVRAVPLASHNLPADGSYVTFLTNDAHTIADALG